MKAFEHPVNLLQLKKHLPTSSHFLFKRKLLQFLFLSVHNFKNALQVCKD